MKTKKQAFKEINELIKKAYDIAEKNKIGLVAGVSIEEDDTQTAVLCGNISDITAIISGIANSNDSLLELTAVTIPALWREKGIGFN